MNIDNLLAIFLRLLISKVLKGGTEMQKRKFYKHFQKQYAVIFLLKTNALIHWWTVMIAWKKQITEKFLRNSWYKTKSCNKKLHKVVFLETVLADITNTLVKTLNNSFKNVFNETFTSQLKPNSKHSRSSVSNC